MFQEMVFMPDPSLNSAHKLSNCLIFSFWICVAAIPSCVLQDVADQFYSLEAKHLVRFPNN